MPNPDADSESAAPDEADSEGTDGFVAPPSLERPEQLEAERVRAAIRRKLFGADTTGPRLGRFELTEPIGSGAMGSVFLATDVELKRDVALKVIRSRSKGEEAAVVRRRLLREARAMAKLRHPNVITVFEAGIIDDQAFIAMEYVPGTTLRPWLAGASRTADDVLSVFVQAGRGLAAAHDAGLVHRDFKPDNVLIGNDGRVQVTDFGVARALEQAHTGGPPSQSPPAEDATADQANTLGTEWSRAGTPRYMAPEQHAGAQTDARTDQFSFCVALFEGLHGAPPFTGDTVEELARAVRAGRIELPPRQPGTGRRVPARLDRVIQRGLSVDPARRYPSMTSLLAALSPPRRSQRSWPLWTLSGISAALVIYLAWPADSEGPSPPRTTPAEPTAAAAASPAAPGSSSPPRSTATISSPATTATAPAIPAAPIEPGRSPDGATWLPAYSIVRHEGDENASFLEAQDGCRSRAMALCTEAQWSRACSSVGALSASESWTATAVTDRGFVVRGGRSSCTARRIVADTDRSPTRTAACCSRAVGVVTDNPHRAFLQVTADKLLKLEQAFSRGNGELLSTLIDDTVTYLARPRSREEFVGLVRRASLTYPDQWLLHDTCEVSLIDGDGGKSWTADCRSVVQQGGSIGHLIRRYLWSGTTGRVVNIGEPNVFRPLLPPK